MTLIKYKEGLRFGAEAQTIIDHANEILAASKADGFGTMTLRQLYYGFISRNWLPANTEKQYKRLGEIMTRARLDGQVSWTAIEDAGRTSYNFQACPTAEEVLDGIEHGLTLNPWHDQDTYMEQWVEKQGLEGTIARPCGRLHVGYMACKGYLSSSEAWRAGQRFAERIAAGKRVVLLYMGDHDPSGVDMSRDNGERLSMFAQQGVEVRRLALNMDQIEEYNPPPQPAKTKDSRFEKYQAEHGKQSWELDALRQSVIGKIITEAIEGYIDREKWDATLARQAELRLPLAKLPVRWKDEVLPLLGDDGLPMERLKALEELDLHTAVRVMNEAVPSGLTDLEFEEQSTRHRELRLEATIVESVKLNLEEIVERAESVRNSEVEHVAGDVDDDGHVLDEDGEDYGDED